MGAAGVGSQVQQIWGVEVVAASAILTLAVCFFQRSSRKRWVLRTGSGYQRPRLTFLRGLPNPCFGLSGPSSTSNRFFQSQRTPW